VLAAASVTDRRLGLPVEAAASNLTVSPSGAQWFDLARLERRDRRRSVAR
jgi:hypothetical protein